MYDNIFTDEPVIRSILTEITTHHAPLTLSALVDGRGLRCPMPLLKTKIALKGISTGNVYVIATDHNSATDIKAFCQKNALDLQSWQDENCHHFLVTKHSQNTGN